MCTFTCTHITHAGPSLPWISTEEVTPRSLFPLVCWSFFQHSFSRLLTFSSRLVSPPRLLPTSLLTPEFSFRYCHWGSPHSSLLVLFHTQITQLHKELLRLGTSAGSLMLGLIKHVLRTWKSGVKVSRERVLSDSWEGSRYYVCCFVSSQSQTVQCGRPQKFDSSFKPARLWLRNLCLETLTLTHTH